MTREDQQLRRRRLLYGRRKGPRLSTHQSNLIATLLPQLRLELDSGLRAFFRSDIEDIWLEIGFGAGEHLLWQARHHPNVGIIGAEPYIAGIAKLLSKISAISSQELGWNPVPGIRIHEGDGADVLEVLPEASVAKVFILFPDPWPKKRHHKRRFVQMNTLDALARAMKDDAELRIASDDGGYIAWTLEHVCAHGAFEWTAAGARDWRIRTDDWPPTRYEQKALHGAPVFLRFRRRERCRRVLQMDGPART